MNRYIILAFLLPGFAFIFGQSVILVNGEAAKVTLDGAEVKTVHEKLPNYMAGYAKPASDIFMKTWSGLEGEAEDPAIADASADKVDRPVLIANSVFFDEGSAILTNKTIESLKKFAVTAQKNGPRTVILKSWYELGNKDNQELISNRLEACKDILELNGVQSSLIFTSYTGAEAGTDYVTVTFQ